MAFSLLYNRKTAEQRQKEFKNYIRNPLDNIKNIYLYFTKLEKEVGLAFTLFSAFLFLLLAVVIAGIDTIVTHIQSTSLEMLAVQGAGILVLLVVIVALVTRPKGVRDAHLWLDQHVFGFLRKSNNAIMDALIFALQPEERTHVDRLSIKQKDHLVQMIFSSLSNDEEIFSRVIKNKIFRLWLWYWLSVYAALSCTLLTFAAFISVVAAVDIYAKIIFSVLWVLTLLQFVIVHLIGRRLVMLSGDIVLSLLDSHKRKIVSVFREQLYESYVEEVEE